MREKRFKNLILRCHFSVEMHPINEEEAERIEREKQEFFKANIKEEIHHEDAKISLSFKDVRRHVLVVLNTDDSESKRGLPWWMDKGWMLISSLAFMRPFYIHKFFASSHHVEWLVLKHYAHEPVESWKEAPAKGRARRSDVASRAFCTKARETARDLNLPTVLTTKEEFLGKLQVEVPSGFPSYWKTQDITLSFDDKINLSAAERQKMQMLVDATFKMKATRDRKDGEMPQRLIVEQVLRIEDSTMWKRYEAKRLELAQGQRPVPVKHLPGSGMLKTQPTDADAEQWPGCLNTVITELNEAFLFHGSNPGAALGIGEHGFDMDRVGSSVGTMFGAGAYFAEASSKSDEYGSQEPSGLFAGRYAFLLCRVLLGNIFHIKESDLPKIQAAMASGGYQSVLGDREIAVGTYREFVAFDQDQIYPEFVVIYRRSFE